MKTSKKCIILSIVLILVISLFAGCGNGDDETPAGNGEPAALSGRVSTNGSTSMENVIGALAEAFMAEHSGVDITYDPTGSGAGITAATEGTADIGLSSRNLKDSETDLDALVIALDGIAIIVNNENPVSDLSIEQIASLATGTVTSWNEVGGNDSPVVVIGREAGSGTRDGFESIIGVTDECLYAQELTSTGAVITAVSSNPNAIGYASLASVSSQVRTLTVDGVEPSESTILDGSYAVQRPFVFVTKSGEELSEQARAFIAFVQSSEAKAIISNAGAFQPN